MEIKKNKKKKNYEIQFRDLIQARLILLSHPELGKTCSIIPKKGINNRRTCPYSPGCSHSKLTFRSGCKGISC